MSARSLPGRPNLRHLKDQARDLVRAGAASSITDAQFAVARLYGFPSWPRLKAYVESFDRISQLQQAIDTDDLAAVQSLMTRHPALHQAPIGYGRNGPLTWAAECRVPGGPPRPARLDIARWLIDHGSDVHQGGDAPLMRAALNGDRIPMMELLVSRGADVNAEYNGEFPIIFASCEAVDARALGWLLAHGASPDPGKTPGRATALDYLIGTYERAPERFSACIDLLLSAGGTTRYDAPGVLDLLRGRVGGLADQLDADPALVSRRHPDMDFGSTGGRRLQLRGATLLHVAAEFGLVEAARLLLARGADVDARATTDDEGVGGQTAMFHAVTQFADRGLPMARLLADHGADLNPRAKLPGHYERPEEVVECTPLGYAVRFPGETRAGESRTAAWLRERGAIE